LKNYNIEVDESVMELLFQKGYNPEYGARPMQRAIQEIIVNPVAEKLFSEEIPEGSTLKVMCRSDDNVFIEVKSSFN
jgi:ATP-dependent Clp protease ATP-binding subunit ClpA